MHVLTEDENFALFVKYDWKLRGKRETIREHELIIEYKIYISVEVK